MNHNEQIYKEFAQHFSSLGNAEHRYYVEGERQTMLGEELNVFEFRCNVSPEENSSEYVYTVEVCIYCESVSDNIFAVQKMFDLVAPLMNNFTTTLGCAQRDCGIKNRFFGRASARTSVVIGTSEGVFTLIIPK